MLAIPVIAIFDIGKTNKKLFLFDENYRIVFELSLGLGESTDEDGFPCENLENIHSFVFNSLQEVLRKKEFRIKAINFSAYGASLVHIGEDGKPVAPLYNYLKPYPASLKERFYNTYGGEKQFSHKTASPVLGNLNSGMQLYWLKYNRPIIYNKIRHSLHLPQYISYLITGVPCTDITSLGCHTGLWDFGKKDYHEWVYKEGVISKLAPIIPSNHIVSSSFMGTKNLVGVGLHDSSAALIPYLVSFQKPFVLISTGTWCITLNPFNNQPLTGDELECDCLSFMTYTGHPVKASRLFGGKDHELNVKRIADFFNQSPDYCMTIAYDPEIIAGLKKSEGAAFQHTDIKALVKESIFEHRDLSSFSSYKEAYHRLILDIVTQQFVSAQLVIKGTAVKRIFVDGGFSKNEVYMNLLASFFPEFEVYAASMAQATSVGTALSIHRSWNKKPLPGDIIKLKYFSTIHPYVS